MRDVRGTEKENKKDGREETRPLIVNNTQGLMCCVFMNADFETNAKVSII